MSDLIVVQLKYTTCLKWKRHHRDDLLAFFICLKFNISVGDFFWINVSHLDNLDAFLMDRGILLDMCTTITALYLKHMDLVLNQTVP